MSTARSVEDYFGPNSVENENVLMTNYWLEYVAARDGRDVPTSKPFAAEDLQAKLYNFTQRMTAVLENQARLRKALGSSGPEPPAHGSPSFLSAQGSSLLEGRPNSVPSSPSTHSDLRDMTGPFSRGKHFVSNCLRDSFILDTLEKQT